MAIKAKRTALHRASMASKIAPTEYHSIVKIMRKAIVAILIIAIVAVRMADMSIETL